MWKKIWEGKMEYKNMELFNVVELLKADDGILMTRIPESLRMQLNEGVQTRAIMPAGCEMRFNLKSGEARIVLKANTGDKGIAEVYQGSFLFAHHFITDAASEIRVALPANLGKLRELAGLNNSPFDPALTRIVLPHRTAVRILQVEGNFALPENGQVPAGRYLAYGSSITHGAASIRPAGSYVMRTAQLLGVDLINIGFGGGAHCEEKMADYLAARQDWDFATLEMGINMVTTFEADEFRRRVEYFISKIAGAHPDKYMFCMDIFPFHIEFPGGDEKTETFRKIVKDAAAAVKSAKVIHIDGRDILKSSAGLTVDLVHPSPAGMEEMALNLSGIIKENMA